MSKDRSIVWSGVALCGAALAWLALSMPADGFFSGDPGVKLIAAFNAIDHPSRPFEIDWPRIAGAPVTDYGERFFAAHGDHAHALQSPVFPVLTAPFIAALGLRGAYILPALSFLVLIPVLAAIARNLRLAVSAGCSCSWRPRRIRCCSTRWSTGSMRRRRRRWEWRPRSRSTSDRTAAEAGACASCAAESRARLR